MKIPHKLFTPRPLLITPAVATHTRAPRSSHVSGTPGDVSEHLFQSGKRVRPKPERKRRVGRRHQPGVSQGRSLTSQAGVVRRHGTYVGGEFLTNVFYDNTGERGCSEIRLQVVITTARRMFGGGGRGEGERMSRLTFSRFSSPERTCHNINGRNTIDGCTEEYSHQPLSCCSILLVVCALQLWNMTEYHRDGH